jgi:hypothetical protein
MRLLLVLLIVLVATSLLVEGKKKKKKNGGSGSADNGASRLEAVFKKYEKKFRYNKWNFFFTKSIA